MNCEQCQKPEILCVCAAIQPQTTHTQILVLQHPQEPDHELGSARLACLALPNAQLKIGLSWRNLAAALGTHEKVDPTRWAVLYLGAGIKEKTTPNALQFVSRQGKPIAKPNEIEGVVILDGTWSQAKALWWRNAWLLKLRRAILTPTRPSLYKELRKEPRRECLSTIESIAEVLEALEGASVASQHLRDLFQQLLDKRRAIS